MTNIVDKTLIYFDHYTCCIWKGYYHTTICHFTILTLLYSIHILRNFKKRKHVLRKITVLAKVWTSCTAQQRLYWLKASLKNVQKYVNSKYCDITGCLSSHINTFTGVYVSRIEQQDALYTKSIPAYVTCLYELGEKSKLYELAQDLVDKLNDNPVSWYAVGIYYMYIKRYGEARRYFRYVVPSRRIVDVWLVNSQATTMDPYFEASWLGYGHAFAAENDHDQAINAYLTCSKLIPGYDMKWKWFMTCITHILS